MINKVISTPIAIGIILALAIIVGAVDYWQYSEIRDIKVAVTELKIPQEKIDTEEICNEMSLAEAKEITVASECGDKLGGNYLCNEDTGTWWIDLDIEKENCAPACVVNTETKEAEINWRCMGAY